MTADNGRQTTDNRLFFKVPFQRSGMEVVNCLYLALRSKYIDQEHFDKLYNELELLTIKIQAFKKSIKTGI